MNLYMTTGTLHFLNKKKQELPAETMLLIENNDQAVLLHETNGTSVFNQPRSYEVLTSIGGLLNEGCVIMQYLNVTEEGKSLFEYRINDISNLLGLQDGILTLRCLRAFNSRTYLILTIWDKESSYKEWKSSKSYDQFNDLVSKDSGIDSVPNIFSKPSYIATYYTSDDS